MKSINKQRVKMMINITVVGSGLIPASVMKMLEQYDDVNIVYNESEKTNGKEITEIYIDEISRISELHLLSLTEQYDMKPEAELKKDTSWQAMNKGVYSKKQRRVKF